MNRPIPTNIERYFLVYDIKIRKYIVIHGWKGVCYDFYNIYKRKSNVINVTDTLLSRYHFIQEFNCIEDLVRYLLKNIQYKKEVL